VVACLGLVAAALVLLIAPARQATATARETIPKQVVGPGPVDTVLRAGQLTLRLSIHPNRAAAWNTVVLAVSAKGRPAGHAAVTVSFTMLSMSMGTATFHLSEEQPGQYVYSGPATGMPGDWKLSFRITPQAGGQLTASVEDRI
jgi:hypothetical protein